ncbi:MAG: hypothetical protein K2K17_07870, partial [Lachnospiraceae bacterium]|nr:hypothetical protein [Lachnospiraceae bacterium]
MISFMMFLEHSCADKELCKPDLREIERQREIEREEKTVSYKILIINPGSTSTKIGVFEDETLLF